VSFSHSPSYILPLLEQHREHYGFHREQLQAPLSQAKFMNRKPDSRCPKNSQGFQDIECQIVEVDGLIRKLTDRDYYLPESSDVGMPDCPGCTFYAYELFDLHRNDLGHSRSI
jgi:hypothetical protein